jgi:adenine-specific DNA-methyltransferase
MTFEVHRDSLNLVAENRRKLAIMFPEARTEAGELDLVRLHAILGEPEVAPVRERFGLIWPGKTECFTAVQTPSPATLLPKLDRSVDFANSQNLIIEGDNLQVLKTLQRSYLNAVGAIYIDPPYNTGNDFIYPDDYSESLQTYLAYTGQVDASGKRFGTTSDTAGRFHSKWLNMMYPRIYLARNLLREDGVILVSIDDHEVHNLHGLLNEIFGEENFCGTFVWEKKRKASFLDLVMASKTEYVLAFAKDRSLVGPFTSGVIEDGKMYPFNNAGNPLSILEFATGSVIFSLADQMIEPCDMSEGNIKTKLLDVLEIRDGRNSNPFRLEGEWRYSQRKVNEFIANGDDIVIRRKPFRPNYINRSTGEKKIANLLTVKGTNSPTYEDATEEIRSLFGADVIEYPKPIGLISFLIEAVTRPDDLVLDFFAGSGTTAHAVLGLNEKDGGSRRFILVQLPEPTGREDYPLITDITEERVRRAAGNSQSRQARLDAEARVQDTGFRVFALDESNVRSWDSSIAHDAGVIDRQLALSVDNIRHDRTNFDLLFEVLLKSGYQLSTRVGTETIAGRTVYSVSDGAFLICLERSLELDFVQAIAERKPERVLLLDEGFSGNDQLKTNAVQTFKSKNIVLKTL